MNVKNITIKKQTFALDIPYVRMMAPEGWEKSVKKYPDSYNGYGYPYDFKVTSTSPDHSCTLNYHCPSRCVDDHLNPRKDYVVDEYGRLHCGCYLVEDILDQWAASALGKYENFHFIKQFDHKGNAEKQAEKEARILKEYEKNGGLDVLNWYVYKGVIREYGYTFKGHSFIRAYSMVLDAVDYVKWKTVYVSPFATLDLMRMVYPYLQYDQDRGQYIYVAYGLTSWMTKDIFSMDCLASDFDGLYQKVFLPAINEGVNLCDELSRDLSSTQKKIDERNAKLRKETEEAAKLRNDMKIKKMQDNRAQRAYFSQTQKDISALRQDSYKKKQATDARVRNAWSDAIRGDTRFEDRYGREHVIRTYDNHAYRSGDTYVTSNSPLDTPFGWEELKKK